MSERLHRSLTELLAMMARTDLSPVELMEATFARLEGEQIDDQIVKILLLEHEGQFVD